MELLTKTKTAALGSLTGTSRASGAQVQSDYAAAGKSPRMQSPVKCADQSLYRSIAFRSS